MEPSCFERLRDKYTKPYTLVECAGFFWKDSDTFIATALMVIGEPLAIGRCLHVFKDGKRESLGMFMYIEQMGAGSTFKAKRLI